MKIQKSNPRLKIKELGLKNTEKKNLKSSILNPKSLLLAFLTFTFCILHLNVSEASAAEQILSVSPIIINVPLSPGKTYNHEVTIQNMTDNALPLRASLNDFQTTGEEGGYVFAESKTNPLLSWITLGETEFILGPKEAKKVKLTITTPNKIPLGGYYGMLFFETLPQNTLTQTTHVLPKIGVLMLANVGVPDPNAKKAEILNFETGFLLEDNQIPLLLRVKNVSLHYFTAKPILTISPLLSLSQSPPIYLEEKIVFQGKIRRWEKFLTLSDAKPNIYKASLMLSTGNGQFITIERYFIVFPFMKVILGALLLLAILFIVRKRKRLKKALQALYK